MPPEITITGANGLTFPSMATWGWEIALYLFLGGVVAGLMLFSGVMRLARPGHFPRALLVADLASLPLLGLGMLCLLFDLSNKLNLWRFYTTFQVGSAMSWGAWVLLVTMAILALRFVSHVPAPRSTVFLGLHFFPPPPVSDEKEDEAEDKEEAKAVVRKPPLAVSFGERVWTVLNTIAQWTHRYTRALALIGLGLGLGLGFYTGVLLSTIPSRPLWNTAILAPLFLVSGLASGGAFLCLFLPKEEHQQLVPFSILACGVELLLLLAFVINLNFGNQATQRAGSLMFNGAFGWTFWGLVILAGLLVPAGLEQLELMHRRVPLVEARVAPVLKLVGSLALRFVIVYAGLLSFT
jgi:protein NrfD